MNIEEISETFELMDEWEERYAYLIELGRKLPALGEGQHSEANKVRGCMSQVWLVGGERADAEMHFNGDSDSTLVKGLIALLLAMVNGKTAEEIRSMDIAATFKALGLESHITVNRRNGFFAMVERIRALSGA
jgi:cysteine desulfuration protein SufE